MMKYAARLIAINGTVTRRSGVKLAASVDNAKAGNAMVVVMITEMRIELSKPAMRAFS